MFVSVDMDNLRFLHKHHDHETVSAVSYLEMGTGLTTRIEHYGDRARFLAGVSDLDARILYRNTTGRDLPDGEPAAIRGQLADAASLMPATRAAREWAEAQVDAVQDRLHAGERFRYAHGSRVPAQPVNLFPLTARPLTAKELGEAAARSRTTYTAYPPRLSGQPARPWDPEPVAAPETVDDPAPTPQPKSVALAHKPKAASGSVKPVVWGAAAKAWAERGEGETWNVVRKRLIPVLVADGLHETTVRIKLAQWGKENGL